MNSSTFPNCLKIPLIVGISGHIDILTPESEIAKCMMEFWNHLRELVGPNTPFILLSSIASGADHLAVKYRPCDVKYCVVLPFDEKDYRKDFSDEALVDFENELKNADKIIRCNADLGNYTEASNYIRKHSDILLTMWDGYESLDPHTSEPKKGGTYYQIRSAFQLTTPPLEFKEKVHWVVNLNVKRKTETPERHAEHGEKNLGHFPEECNLLVLEWGKKDSTFVATSFAETCKQLSSQDEMKNDSEKYEETTNVIPVFPVILKRIREHNENLPSESRKDYYLRGDIEKESKDNQTMETCFRLVEEDIFRLEYFDEQAEKHQRPFCSQFKRIAIGSIIVGLLGQAWGDIVFSSDDMCHEIWMHFFIGFYLFGFGCLFAYYMKTKKDAHYSKYIRPRLIAEMLRLKIFWTLADIRESFSDYFLEECAGYWFMFPVCNWELGDTPLSDKDRSWLDDGNGLDAVKKFWLEDQDKYYAGYLLENPKSFIIPEKGEKCKSMRFLSMAWLKAYFIKYERCEAYSRLCKSIFIWGGILLSILLLLVFIITQIKEPSSLKHKDFLYLARYREFIVGICPFVVATLGWMMEKHQWGQIALQYRKALSLFRKTEQYIGENHSVLDRRQMIKEMILYAHHENAEWNEIKNGAKPEPMI